MHFTQECDTIATMRFIALIGGNILALFLASLYIDGVSITGGWQELVIVGLILSVFNFILKPVLKLLLSPFILLTFGLLLIAINIALVWATDFFSGDLAINGLQALLLTTLAVVVVNFIIHLFFRKK